MKHAYALQLYGRLGQTCARPLLAGLQTEKMLATTPRRPLPRRRMKRVWSEALPGHQTVFV